MEDIKTRNKMFAFKTTTHPYFERGKIWFILMFLIFLFLAGLFVYLKQYISSLVFLVFGLVIYIYSQIPPKEILCIVSNEGIKIGERFFPKNHLKSFWISEAFPPAVLHLELTKRFYFPISISLKKPEISSVRRILSTYLPERAKPSWDIQDKIARFLRL